MSNQRRFDALEVAEIRRLMELAIEAGLHAHDFSPRLLRAYGAMAAEFGFELWSREQARRVFHRDCGRSLTHGPVIRPVRGH